MYSNIFYGPIKVTLRANWERDKIRPDQTIPWFIYLETMYVCSLGIAGEIPHEPRPNSHIKISAFKISFQIYNTLNKWGNRNDSWGIWE